MSKDPNDKALKDVIANQNETWIEQLSTRHRKALEAIACRYLHDDAAAKDAVSEVILKHLEKKNFKSESALKGSLFRSITNACLNYMKRQKVKDKASSELGWLLQQEQTAKEPLIISPGMLVALTDEIEALPLQPRLVIKLRLDGMDIQQIAVKLDKSAKTVRNQITEALKMIKAEFLKKGVIEK